ncbi:MAG: chemotaxis protein CheC [Ignavibacteriales bacterium]|nr:chemotaxis protein CheC [Ignavibacteriales bacterium]
MVAAPEGFALLQSKEADTLGEIGNISMGSAATTLSMLLGNRVEITTPVVKECQKIENIIELSQDYILVEIKYAAGLEGSVVFLLKKDDTAIIADLMMGGDGKVVDPEIGELQLSSCRRSHESNDRQFRNFFKLYVWRSY